MSPTTVQLISINAAVLSMSRKQRRANENAVNPQILFEKKTLGNEGVFFIPQEEGYM